MHRILTILAFLLGAGLASANQRVQGWCEQGGVKVLLGGMTSSNSVLGSYPKCTVTVYSIGGGPLTTLYSDNLGTPLANPFTADDNGRWFFYATNGRYDVTLSGGGLLSAWTIYDVLLADPGVGYVTTFNTRVGDVVPQAGDYTWSLIGGTKQGNTNVPQMAGANTGILGDTLCNDASGNATTAGCHGTSDLPAATAQLQYLRTRPNSGNLTTFEFAALAPLNASDYNFPAQAPGGALTSGVSNTITMTPCPLGVAGADVGHYLYVLGGMGTAEAVLITGGTCTSGLASGTIIFTPVNNHSGAWTIASATGGIQEAIMISPAWWTVQIVPPADSQYFFALNARTTIDKSIIIEGSGSMGAVSVYRTSNYPNGDLFVVTPGVKHVTFKNLNILADAPGHVGGATIRTAAANMLTVTDVQIANGQYGIVLDGTGLTFLNRVRYVNVDMTFQAVSGLHLMGGAINTYVSDSQFYGAPASNANVLAYGMSIADADGVWVSNSGFGGAMGIFFDLSGATAWVLNVNFHGCQVDTVRVAAVGVTGNAAIAGNWRFDDCHFHGQAGNGGALSGVPLVYLGYGGTISADNIQFHGGSIEGGDMVGLWVGKTGAQNIQVTDVRISGNNIGNTAGLGAVQVVTGVTGLTMIGNTIGNHGAGHQKYAIVFAGSLGNSLVSDNRVDDNETGTIQEVAPAYTNVKIEDNLGIDDVIGSVAAATNITLPLNPVVKITGTVAAVATMTPAWAGRKVRLIFTDANPDGVTTGGNILRAQVAVQYQAIDLSFDGTNWY